MDRIDVILALKSFCKYNDTGNLESFDFMDAANWIVLKVQKLESDKEMMIGEIRKSRNKAK